MKRRRMLSVCLVAVAAAAAWVAKTERPPRPAQTQLEKPLPLQPEVEDEAWTPDLRPPRTAEVLDTVARVFTGALPAESVQAYRAVAGDFNGDHSPDLAVPARLVPALLPAINNDLANWTIQDPDTWGEVGHSPSPAPEKIAARDPLLAVVHGLGPSGWRNPSARQGYLVKAAPSAAFAVMARTRFEEAARKAGTSLPRLRGDLLWDEGGARFLYWTGGHYVWHRRHAS